MATGTQIEVVMPQMGVSVSEGTITKWLKSEGEPIARDEALLEISTDKVDTEVPSPGEGVVAKIMVQEGETVEVGAVLAVIAPAGSEVAGAERGGADGSPSGARHAGSGRCVRGRSERDRRADGSDAASRPGSGRALQLRPRPARTTVAPSSPPSLRGSPPSTASTSAACQGTGNAGRVTKKDILAFVESGASAQAAPEALAAPEAPALPRPRDRPRPSLLLPPQLRRPPRPPPQAAPAAAPVATGEPAAGETLEPLTAMRRGIAEHMRRSLDTSAHVTSAIEVDMSKVVAIRGKLKKEFEAAYGVNPTYLAFIARATVETLREYPWINGEIRGDKIVTRNYVNLGFAVELADGKGLIVPVVKNCEGLNLLGLARSVVEIAQKRPRQEAEPGRRPGRNVHDHESGRLRHLPRNPGDQPAAGGNPRHLRGRQAAVGRPGRAGPGRDRDPADDEPDPDVRPSPRRRCPRRAFPPRPPQATRELGRE